MNLYEAYFVDAVAAGPGHLIVNGFLVKHGGGKLTIVKKVG